MNNNKKSSYLCLCMAVFLSSAVFAAGDPDNRYDAMREDLVSLRSELKLLRGELAHLKHRNRSGEAISQKRGDNGRHEALQNQAFASNALYGEQVFACPFASAIDGGCQSGDLFVNLPSIATDLNLLRARSRAEKEGIMALTGKDGPVLSLSGMVEVAAGYGNGYNKLKSSSSNIALSSAEMHFFGIVNPFLSSTIIVNYDSDSPGQYSDFRYKTSNSNLRVDRAFITVGNLSRSPFYFSIGQHYVPFGRYSSYMITKPLTKILGRTKARSVNIGYSKDSVYGGIFAFKGDSYVSNSSIINQFGANLGYAFIINGVGIDYGASYISNIADSAGIQKYAFGNNDRHMFAKPGEKLAHRVDAVDVYAMFNFMPYALRAEYVGSLRAFDPSDLSFNKHGARLQALAVEGAYKFDLFGHSSNIALGYDMSFDAFALDAGMLSGVNNPIIAGAQPMPRNSYILAFNTEFWPRTLASLELRHNIHYRYSDSATNSYSNSNIAFSVSGMSRAEDVINLRFAVYF